MDRQLSEAVPNPQPISFRRMLLNGTLDEYLYSRGRLVANGLTFPALKQQAHINGVAHTVTHPAQYSAKIREGRAGF
jgi:hypothetical protein